MTAFPNANAAKKKKKKVKKLVNTTLCELQRKKNKRRKSFSTSYVNVCSDEQSLSYEEGIRHYVVVLCNSDTRRLNS